MESYRGCGMIPDGNIGAVDSFPGVSLRSTARLHKDDALSGNNISSLIETFYAVFRSI